MRINSIGNLVFVLLLHVFYPLPTWVAPLGVESRTRAPRTLSNLQQAFPTYFTIQHRFASQLGSYSTVNCLRLPTWTLSFIWLRHPTGLNTAVLVSPSSLPIVYTLFTSHSFIHHSQFHITTKLPTCNNTKWNQTTYKIYSPNCKNTETEM